MKKEQEKTSWFDKKCKNKKFKKMFVEEYEKLSIAEQLVKIRLSAGLTQDQLAQKIGTTASAISRYENSNYCRYELQTIQKIVTACNGRMKVVIENAHSKKAA